MNHIFASGSNLIWPIRIAAEASITRMISKSIIFSMQCRTVDHRGENPNPQLVEDDITAIEWLTVMTNGRWNQTRILQNIISCLFNIKMRNEWKFSSKTKINKQIGYSLNGGCLIDVFVFAVRISDVKRNFILIEFMKADTLFGIIALLKSLIKRMKRLLCLHICSRRHFISQFFHSFFFLSSQLIIITIQTCPACVVIRACHRLLVFLFFFR